MRVLLKKLHSDQAQELFDLTDANRRYLREWLPWLDQTTTVKDTMAFIESTGAHSPTYVVMVDHKLCGVVGFHRINQANKYASIGYWLGESYTGNGIMTQAVKAILQIGFEEYQLNKIEIRCATENRKSCALAERLGFTHEANLRECEWLYSKYVDHAVYSLLACEYHY